MYSLFLQNTGKRERSPTTKNCAPQTTAICGSVERQPPRGQWMASARRSLLCDQGIRSARRKSANAVPLPKILQPKQPLFAEVANVSHPESNGWPPLEEASFVIKAFAVPGNSSFSLCWMFMCHSAIVREVGKPFYNEIHCPAYHETAQTGLRNYKKKQYPFARR
ncbi:hypothetical protein TNIN_395691 [Trichonephila inaurata madagascariensis]|uniref:Uncharacterized protein n=1 Tax=Trichonephila inaurata madagascariensis TaxID=2747483 RepID=A0A8X6X1K9_9ARAC|nr:hypothetical protein TNIN_395691 [Trichonephila inaurata madagascariensis]